MSCEDGRAPGSAGCNPAREARVMTKIASARRPHVSGSGPGTLKARAGALDWPRLGADLDAHGCATTGPLLTPGECAGLASLYAADAPFRSRIVMARHGFGRGE